MRVMCSVDKCIKTCYLPQRNYFELLSPRGSICIIFKPGHDSSESFASNTKILHADHEGEVSLASHSVEFFTVLKQFRSLCFASTSLGS